MILHTHIMVLWCLENFLQAVEVEKHPPKQLVAQGIFKKISSKSPFWVGIEPQKWPLAHVLNCRNRLRCRAVLPFAFTDWYDPKQHCKYLGWHAEAYRKYFGNSQSCVSHLENTTFWLKCCVLALFYLENGYTGSLINPPLPSKKFP